jgi:hypothetical membrane protein
MRTVIRSLAWGAVAVQVAFVASWIVAGALTPGYSHTHSGVSALAAHGMPHPWIVMAGFVLVGLSAIAVAVGVGIVLPARRAATVAAMLFAVAGIGFLVVAFARLDCDLAQHACSTRFHHGDLSWRTSLHAWTGLVVSVAIIGTAFALARALWPSPTGALALAAGVDGALLLVAALLLYSATDGAGGIVERVQLVVAQAWFAIVAAGILYETRGVPRVAPPTPLRPRDFFGSAWAGEGQVQAWPYFAWRRLAPRFTFTRSTTWKSEDVGLVRDRATFGDGRVEERLRFAHMLDPSHIHVTSDDLPDGVDVTIDEAGYRTAPYRGLVPVGPLRLVVSCRDESRLEPDGTLVYRVYARWHGLPVGRLDMCARTVDDTSMPAVGTTGAAAG